MAFQNVRLPEDVERGAVGGPRFNTSVVIFFSGHEQRNQNWQDALGEWDISYGIDRLTDLQAVVNHFYNRRGRLHSFPFKDWSDFEVATQQFLKTGDDTADPIQLFKRYDDASGSLFFDRDVTLPINGTVVIEEDSVPLTEGVDYTIDYTTGIVTPLSPVSSAVTWTWAGEFDKRVRYDTDKLEIRMEVFDVGELPSIQITEVRID